MNIVIAYLILVAIWSTTPIAIQYGATGLSFSGAIFWRILISAVLALVIIKFQRQRLFGPLGEWKYYLVGTVGVAPNFLLVYWASLWIPSGLISIIFSTVPFLMGLLSYLYLGKNVFTRQKVLALLIAFSGLIIIFFDQLNIAGNQAIYGCLAMVLSVLLFAMSSTILQKMDHNISAFQLTTGSLWFSLPPLALCWWWLDGQPPQLMSLQAGISIVYLGVFGSLLGFVLYFQLLRQLSAFVVSTVGMISPVFALLLGNLLAGEVINQQMIFGAFMVLSALALYHMPAVKPSNLKEEL